MSDPALLEMPPPLRDGVPSLQARIAALRDAGQRLAPARLHYLEVLLQRMATTPDAVRRVLEARLDAALTALEERLRQAQTVARNKVARLSAEPLVQLNQYLQSAKHDATGSRSGIGMESSLGHSLAGDSEARSEMASVRRFREAWSRIAAEDQVIEAVERGPANAGPLNSHMLVLRSLALLRELSPDYLRRFLTHVETLQWLEHTSQTITPVKAKPVRRSRVKK